MDAGTFEALLSKYKVVRSRDYEGVSCREWSIGDARAYRLKVAEEKESAKQKSHYKGQRRGHDPELSTEFFTQLKKELTESGCKNVEQVVQEMKEIYIRRLYGYNLEQLEQLLENISS
mmetsp:Transcript_7500/g.12050  ORF Transcript_7500/g.12050 Transcript_7500/m.12050 type:complete len:118 (-) Transcript_7500:2282-2635(-)